MNGLNWVFEHIPLLIFGFVLFSVVRAVMRAAQLSAQHKAGASETEEQKRVREIQERIRRKIAERRGGVAPSVPEPSPASASLPPVVRRMTVPPLEPFGGPSRRVVVTETPRRVATPEPATVSESAIMARQEQLAAQMRALEYSRANALRRAESVAQEAATAARDRDLAMQRAGWIADLREPQGLRRAFVLREVLGPPVALR